MAEWFNYRGYSNHPDTKAQAEHLAAEMLSQRQRQPNAEDQKKFVRSMTVAIAGLRLSGAYQRTDIYIPLNRNHYYGETQRSPVYQPELLKCFRWLIENDYLTRTKNHSFNAITGYARPATYQLSRKWLESAINFPPSPPGSIVRNREAPFIELRDGNGRYVENISFSDYDICERRLTEYDKRLSRHVFEHQGIRQEPAIFSLTRIFSRGSYTKGGRYYSAFQQWPSIRRQQLTIDGKETVEVDYKSLHPFLLYQQVKRELPADPYMIEGYDRATVKRAFAILINRSKPDECWRSFCYFLRLKKEPAMDLESRLRALHSPIERYFGTGIGLELQYFDSTLCENVIDYMMNRGSTIVLPIHDSFLVKVSDLESLSEALKYAEVNAAKKLGTEPRSSVLLESEALGAGAFTDAALRQAFPGIEKTTWESVEIIRDEQSAQSLTVEEARMEGYLEDSVIED